MPTTAALTKRLLNGQSLDAFMDMKAAELLDIYDREPFVLKPVITHGAVHVPLDSDTPLRKDAVERRARKAAHQRGDAPKVHTSVLARAVRWLRS